MIETDFWLAKNLAYFLIGRKGLDIWWRQGASPIMKTLEGKFYSHVYRGWN